MDNLKLFNELQKVWLKMDSAKSYVDDGKEVLCSQKLQGAMTNLSIIIELLGDEIKKNVVVKEDSSSNG